MKKWIVLPVAAGVFLLFQNFSNAVIDTCPPALKQSNVDILSRLSTAFGKTEKGNIKNGVNGYLEIFTQRKGGSISGEIHAATFPKTAVGTVTNGQHCENLSSHPIGGTLIELIDHVPAKSGIGISVFIFTNAQLKAALLRAIARGVQIQVLTTDSGAKMASALSDAISSQAKISGNVGSFATLCPHKTKDKAEDDGEETSSGACIGNHLNHNKFAIFSKICRFGISNSTSDCYVPAGFSDRLNLTVFKNAVFQTSWNFANGAKLEMATVALGSNKLYAGYLEYFNQMKKGVRSKPNLNFQYSQKMKLDDSSILTLNFTPSKRTSCGKMKSCDPIRKYRQSDLFLKELQFLNRNYCSSGKGILRIANTHWNDGKDLVATEIIDRIKEIVKAGCIVKVLVPANMASSLSAANSPVPVKPADIKIVERLTLAGAQVRSFADAPNISAVKQRQKNPNSTGVEAANMHAKFVLLETNIAGPQSVLMFGSMSFLNISQIGNDESWHVWKNSNHAYKFYSDVFDMQWKALPEK